MTTESTTPQSAEGWFQKGVTLGRAGDNQDAIAFWNKLGWAKRVELATMSQNHINAP